MYNFSIHIKKYFLGFEFASIERIDIPFVQRINTHYAVSTLNSVISVMSDTNFKYKFFQNCFIFINVQAENLNLKIIFFFIGNIFQNQISLSLLLLSHHGL